MNTAKITTALLLLSLCCNSQQSRAESSPYLLTPATYQALQTAQKAITANQHQTALDQLQTLIHNNQLNDYDTAVTYQVMGYAENGLGNSAAAVRYFSKALAFNTLPKDVTHELYFTTAQLLIQLDRLKEGINYLSIWFKDEVRPNADAHILAATVYYRLGDFKQLIHHAKRAINLATEPSHNTYKLLLAAYFETKNYQAAAAILKKMIALTPDDPSYWRQLAGAYQRLGDDNKALATYELAYTQKLLASNEVLQLINYYLYLGLPYKAAALLEQAITDGTLISNQKNLTLLANSWLAARENERAKSTLTELVTKFNDTPARLRLGQLYIELEQWRYVIATLDVETFSNISLKETHKINPTMWAEGNLLLGIAQYHNDNHTAATHALTYALTDETTASQAKWWLDQLKKETKTTQ